MITARLRPALSTASLTGLAGFGLIRFAPAITELRAGLFRPHAWIERVGPDATLACFTGALLWVATLWFAAGLIAAILSQLPGRPGRAARAFVRRALPSTLRKLVLTSTGASLLISPVAATAASPTSAGPTPTAAATPFWPLDQPGRPLPAPSWPVLSNPVLTPAPTTPAPITPATVTTATSQQAPGPVRQAPMPPRSVTPSSTAGSTATTTTPPAPTPVVAQPADPAPPASTPPASADSVIVQPGDSLWTIAAHRLGSTARASQVAVDWPYWYRANRRTIGRDPNLVRAGTKLIVPALPLDSAR